MAATTLRDYLQYTEDAISSGHIDEALAQCQRILSHYPESLEAQRLLGEVYLAQEQLEEAQQAFDWILTNDPENVVVYCDRALICERMADYDTALDCYQQAYELSRGNRQIRHEFNKLSARVGQQGFMLSRTGLARLYMRGDLLPQAIQEWETVLATSPDRLDARTGLLEAYWREGLFEQVEELANAILSDVPGCLKALLLLAHVTSLKDMQRAEDLIRRAEMLDPELIMAQELFSDLIAHHPQDPFLQLLTHESVLLPEQRDSLSTPEASVWNTTIATNGSHEPAASPSDELFNWSSLDTLIVDSQQQDQPERDIPTFSWSGNSALDMNSWSTIDQLAGQPPASESVNKAQTPAEPEQEANQHLELSPARDTMIAPEGAQEVQSDEPVADVFDAWSSAETTNQRDDVPDAVVESMWNMEAREEVSLPTPPAWLDMLTKGRPQSLSTPPAPSGLTSEGQAETPVLESASSNVSPATGPSTPDMLEPAVPAPLPWEDNQQTAPTGEEDEALSFGPEWLKSLGAEVLESEQEQTQQEAPDHSWLEQLNASPSDWQMPIDPWQEEPAQPPSTTQTDVDVQQEPIDSLPEANPEPAQTEAIVEQELIDASPAQQQQEQESVSSTPEQQYATLEVLERDLLAQGFVPLEPGSLARIAEEESLSSALAPFGTTPEQLSTAVDEDQPPPAMQTDDATEAPLAEAPTEEDQPASSLQQEAEQPVQAEKPDEQKPVSAPEPETLQPANVVEADAQQPALEPVVETEAQQTASAPVAQPETPSSSAVEEPLWLPTPISAPAPPTDAASNPMQEPILQAEETIQRKSAGVNDTALDELELTMRRPVTKLQPTTQNAVGYGTGTPGQAQSTTPGRSRSGPANRAEESNLSNKERLRKGYHYQLAGDYDEAMQEYRIIIRNAPELLGEIISNMRALLKLAPRYAPGYRVLGDAYMRQGEYLQAMEAYNKALMMAKKGHGQAQGKR